MVRRSSSDCILQRSRRLHTVGELHRLRLGFFRGSVRTLTLIEVVGDIGALDDGSVLVEVVEVKDPLDP